MTYYATGSTILILRRIKIFYVAIVTNESTKFNRGGVDVLKSLQMNKGVGYRYPMKQRRIVFFHLLEKLNYSRLTHLAIMKKKMGTPFYRILPMLIIFSSGFI